MRVRIDDAANTFILGQLPPAPIEIETLRRGVDLYPRARFRGGIEQRRNVHYVRLAL